MTERQKLLESIATTTADYRKGEVPVPTPEHVDRWVRQFDPPVQLSMLRELDHVFKRTYFSLERVTGFLRGLIKTEKLVGKDVCAFWQSANFLDIQGGGNSQTEMLQLFGEVLKEKCGFGLEGCDLKSDVYVYLDDAIFTGNRVRRDLEGWIAKGAPHKATLHVISIALHLGGQYYAGQKLSAAARAAGKQIDITWWRAIEVEDRRAYTNMADVLRPTAIPNDVDVRDYVSKMKYAPTLRNPGNQGALGIFSGEVGKVLLEQELLKAGAKIRRVCTNLGDTQRPLGHVTLDTLGFGSLVVTFRNCPNNAPLALWVGDPWYPLFPRTTNSQTAVKKMFQDLTKVQF